MDLKGSLQTLLLPRGSDSIPDASLTSLSTLFLPCGSIRLLFMLLLKHRKIVKQNCRIVKRDKAHCAHDNVDSEHNVTFSAKTLSLILPRIRLLLQRVRDSHMMFVIV